MKTNMDEKEKFFAREKSGRMVWQEAADRGRPISQDDLETIAVLDAAIDEYGTSYIAGLGMSHTYNSGYAPAWVRTYRVNGIKE